MFIEEFELYKIPIIANGVRLPEYRPTKEQYEELGLKSEVSNYEFLCKLCKVGLDKRIVNKVKKEQLQEYFDRCDEELSIIESLGFTDYILIIWDICYFGDKNGIPRGPGRGSVCSSLVCFATGITEIDAIEHQTLFTRFLNKARAKVNIVDGIKYVDGSLTPDIDQDQCYFRRKEILEYIGTRYPGKTCKLLTLSTLSSKILIKDVLKIIEEASEPEANLASDLIEKEFGIPEDIDAAMLENDKFKEWSQKHQQVCKIAISLSGLIRGHGQHASAVLLAYDNISDLIPLQLSSTKEVISGYDMYSSQQVLLKIDELGLKTVSHVDKICKLVGIRADDIDIYDKSIYDFLQDFRFSYGIFQFESFAQGSIAKKIRPKCFHEILCGLAISRPGASSFLSQYLDYIHRGIYKSIHPIIDKVLKPFGGVCLFQESLLKMLNNLGMDLDSCELLRRGIGKKDQKAIQEYKQKIYDVCEKNKHPKEVANLVWKIADDSKGYQFSISHSAAYSKLCCQTIYLKVHYPKEFFLTLLQMSIEESDQQEIVSNIHAEMRQYGIKLLPPHLLKSDMDFTIEGDNIRFGLISIKGLTPKTVEKLNKFKHQYSSKFEIFEGASQSNLSIGITCALLAAGALDDIGNTQKSRSKLVLEACVYNLLTENEVKLALLYGEKYNYDLFKLIKALNQELKNEKGKPLIKDSRLETIKKRYQPYKQIYEQNKKSEPLANWWYEKTLLGYTYDQTLKHVFRKEYPNLMTIEEVNNAEVDEYVSFVGFIKETTSGTAKNAKKTKYFKMSLSDESAACTVLTFNDNILTLKAGNKGKLPNKEDIIVVKGVRKGDAVFSNHIEVQNHRIFLKLKDIKSANDRKNEEKGEITLDKPASQE